MHRSPRRRPIWQGARRSHVPAQKPAGSEWKYAPQSLVKPISSPVHSRGPAEQTAAGDKVSGRSVAQRRRYCAVSQRQASRAMAPGSVQKVAASSFRRPNSAEQTVPARRRQGPRAAAMMRRWPGGLKPRPGSAQAAPRSVPARRSAADRSWIVRHVRVPPRRQSVASPARPTASAAPAPGESRPTPARQAVADGLMSGRSFQRRRFYSAAAKRQAPRATVPGPVQPPAALPRPPILRHRERRRPAMGAGDRGSLHGDRSLAGRQALSSALTASERLPVRHSNGFLTPREQPSDDLSARKKRTV